MPDKSIAQKMLIKKGNKILILNLPKEHLIHLGDLPEGTQIITNPEGKVDILLAFIQSKKDLEIILNRVRNWLGPKSIFWIGYPKGTSGIKTDINRDIISELGKTQGFFGVSMISLDEIWSGFRFKEV